MRTVQVYVATIPEGFGPVVFEQELTPPVPDIAQLTTPDGVTAPVDPVTVAV